MLRTGMAVSMIAEARPGSGQENGMEEREILAEIQRGELRRFDAFVDRYKIGLMRYLHSQVGDSHLAEDLTQEVFLRAFRATERGGFAGDSSIGTWLFAIARNCAIDALRAGERRDRRQRRVAEDGREAIAAADPVAAAIESEERLRAEGLLRRLPEPQRQAMALKVFGDLTAAEIAQVMQCEVATAKSRVRYAAAKLREMLHE